MQKVLVIRQLGILISEKDVIGFKLGENIIQDEIEIEK